MLKVDNTLIVFASRQLAFNFFASWLRDYTVKENRSENSYLYKVVFDVKNKEIEAKIIKLIKEFAAEEFPEFY